MFEEDVRAISGDFYYTYWINLKPKVYYVDDKPYGLMSAVDWRGGKLICSATLDDSPFTFSMIRDIRRIADTNKVYILHDVDREDIQDTIIRCFGKNFVAKKLKTHQFRVTVGRKRWA